MYTLYTIFTGLGQDDLHTAIWIVPALLLLVAGMVAFFSLRQAICFFIAAAAGLVGADITLFGSATLFDFSGPGSHEAGIIIFFFALGVGPVAFITGLILANLFLPKSLLANVSKAHRSRFAAPAFFIAAFICLCLSETVWFLRQPRIESAEAFEALAANDPSALSNKRFNDFHRQGERLVLENQTISGARFVKAQISDLSLKNIIFKNCYFKQSYFENISMENVTFNNCTFKGSSALQTSRTGASFRASTMRNVMINGGVVDDFFAHIKKGGNVILKNVSLNLGEKGFSRLFDGRALSLRVDNCLFGGSVHLHDGDGNNEAILQITNSRFLEDTVCAASNMKVVWIDNCRFEGRGISTGQTMVVKNSYLKTNITQSGQKAAEQPNQMIYVENCVFPLRTGMFNWKFGTTFLPESSSQIFIYGKKPRQKGVNLAFRGGRVSLFDAEVGALDLRGGDKFPPLEMNLHNVIIKGGAAQGDDYLADWSNTDLVGGLWNEVSVYPQVDVENLKIKNVRAHKLLFPEGRPWVKATEDSFVSIIESQTPLEIPRPPVPTLQELGVVDPLETGFWPDGTPLPTSR